MPKATSKAVSQINSLIEKNQSLVESLKNVYLSPSKLSLFGVYQNS